MNTAEKIHVVFYPDDFKSWGVWEDLVERLGENPHALEF